MASGLKIKNKINKRRQRGRASWPSVLLLATAAFKMISIILIILYWVVKYLSNKTFAVTCLLLPIYWKCVAMRTYPILKNSLDRRWHFRSINFFFSFHSCNPPPSPIGIPLCFVRLLLRSRGESNPLMQGNGFPSHTSPCMWWYMASGLHLAKCRGERWIDCFLASHLPSCKSRNVSTKKDSSPLDEKGKLCHSAVEKSQISLVLYICTACRQVQIYIFTHK